MENYSLLNQKIEFLEINLEDMQKREVQIKSNYDKMIDSLLHINCSQNHPTETEKLEELRKKHSNELLIIKCFFKQRLEILQEKLSLSKASAKQLKDQSIDEKVIFGEKISDLELNTQKLQQENCRLKIALNDSSNKLTSCESQLKYLESLNKELEHQREQLTNEVLAIHKDHNDKLYELKEIHEQEKLSLRKSNQLMCTIDSIELNNLYGIFQLKKIQEKLISLSTEWKSSIESTINSFESQISSTSNFSNKEKAYLTQVILKYSTSTLEKFQKFSKSIKTIREDLIEIKHGMEALSVTSKSSHRNNSEASLEKPRFSSPIHEKSFTLGSKQHSSSCRKLERNSLQKPPVHSPTHLRAQTLNQPQSTPFTIPFSSNIPQRHSNLNISVSLQKSLDINESSSSKKNLGVSHNENIPCSLKIQISKAKNQRDKARLDNEKMLMELKESKFLLAIEKERYCEKLNKIENEFKNVLKVIKRVNDEVNVGEMGRQSIGGSIQCITRLLTIL